MVVDVNGEFLVNSQTASFQDYPSITSLTNGGFVVTWYDGSGTLGDASDGSIKAKIFNASGALVTDEFLVNSETADSQNDPSITSLTNGGFVVTWYDHSGTLGDTSGTSIKAKIFDASGALMTDEFLVNSQTASYQYNPSITSLTNGGFVVTWCDESGTLGDTSGASIKARIFDSLGNPVLPSNPTNRPPVAASAFPDASSLHGDTIDINLANFFTDADGDTLSFSAGGLPQGLSLSSVGRVTGTLSAQVGNYAVTVTANDGHGGTASHTFDWDVLARQLYQPTSYDLEYMAKMTAYSRGSKPLPAGYSVDAVASATFSTSNGFVAVAITSANGEPVLAIRGTASVRDALDDANPFGVGMAQALAAKTAVWIGCGCIRAHILPGIALVARRPRLSLHGQPRLEYGSVMSTHSTRPA